MNTENQNKHSVGTAEAAGNFYQQLPRFVSGLSVSSAVGELPLQPVERIVEMNGHSCVLTILPARVILCINDDNSFEEQFRMPGDFEKLLEKTLRALAVIENPNFNQANNSLYCSLSQLSAGINFPDDNINPTEEQINVALNTLANAAYILRQGSNQFYFRTIQQLRQTEVNGELHYQLYFAPLFFNDRRSIEHLLTD